MPKFIFAFVAAAVCLTELSSPSMADAALAQDRAAPREVTVGVQKSFPPYYLLDEDGNPSGFAVDAMNEVAKRANLLLTYRVAENGAANFKAIRAGDIDIIPSLGISDHRKQYVAFTAPVDTFRIMLFTRNNTQGVTGIDDMAGRPVAVVIDNVGYRFLKKKRPDIQIKLFPTFTEALFALLSAKVDAFAYPELVTWKLAREAGVADRIKVAAKSLFETKRAMAVRKDDTELLAALDRAVRDFIASPEYQKVYVTWFGKPVPYWTVTRVVQASVILFALLLIGMGVWRYYSLVRLSRELHKSETRFRRYTESSSDYYWEMDENLRFSELSERFTEVTGLPVEELLGKTREETGIPDIDPELWVAHLTDLAAHRPIVDFIHPRTHPGGRIVWLSVNGLPIFDEAGVFKGYGGTAQDITERKRAEEVVKLSEGRFRSAFQSLATGNIVIDDAGVIEIFNLSAEEIFGYSADEAIGRNVSMLMPEPDRGRHDGFIQGYLDSGVPRIIGIGREVTGLRKNGETFPMRLGVGEMKVGDSSSFVSSISDLTEIKALEAKLFQSQKLEAVGLLTGGVAHDFNNLMAIMMGNAELLEGMLGDNPKASGYIEDIIQAVERGSSLTQHLLAFSRKQILSPKETDVNQLVLGLEDMLGRTLGEMVELKVTIGRDTCLAMIDPSQLEMVMINLAVNAKDAMPQGGLLIIETTTVSLDEAYTSQREDVEPGDYVEVAVSDTGTGMPPEILEHVFEPFFTTKDVGQGSGLGLSMVFGFAKQSKGHASIYSEVGKGTTVKIFLPCATSGKGDTAAKEARRSESERGHERILVVEDDESVRNIPSAMLRAQGYEVVEVMDGAQAMEILKNEPPFDLLFTDVVLPGGMNGVEISAQAKLLQPNIKTLYTTGYTENAIIHNGELEPGVTLVSKPYRRQELLDKVRALLDSES